MSDLIKQHVSDTRDTMAAILADEALLAAVEEAAKQCANAVQHGGKILFAGNGGSAADAQHLAAELTCRYSYDRPALPGIALTTDTSALTAISNDYAYEQVFSRQLEALGKAGDIFMAFSTSGNSGNIIKALEVARANNIKTIGFTGGTGGKMLELCDLVINIPSKITANIQEGHITLGHCVCDLMQQLLK